MYILNSFSALTYVVRNQNVLWNHKNKDQGKGDELERIIALNAVFVDAYLVYGNV